MLHGEPSPPLRHVNTVALGYSPFDRRLTASLFRTRAGQADSPHFAGIEAGTGAEGCADAAHDRSTYFAKVLLCFELKTATSRDEVAFVQYLKLDNPSPGDKDFVSSASKFYRNSGHPGNGEPDFKRFVNDTRSHFADPNLCAPTDGTISHAPHTHHD